MVDQMVTGILDTIQQYIADLWTGLWAPMFDGWPLYWSWGVFGCILLACAVVAIFVQFKWPRLALGLVVAGAGLWLFGRHTMYNEMKAKLNEERARKATKPKPQDPSDGGWFGGWR